MAAKADAAGGRLDTRRIATTIHGCQVALLWMFAFRDKLITQNFFKAGIVRPISPFISGLRHVVLQ